MTNDIVEADQPMGTAAAVIEKAARQLVYDSRYKVSQKLGKKKKDIDPRTFDAMVLQQISKSQGPAVARAKQMLLKKRGPVKEDFIPMMEDAAANSVANAMFKVFVEGVKVEQEIELNYLKELDEKKERKYKVRVTDKKTRNSYVRYATREKISELRANPNILSVEITEYGEPREGERKQGASTAKAKAGRSLDPVGKEDPKGDVDNDNIPASRDKNDQYLLKRRKAIGNAIATRKEEFIADAAAISADPDANTKKITGLKAGETNKVVVFPNDSTTDRQGTGSATPRSVYAHTELKGDVIAETGYQKFLNMIQEKAESEQQQKLFGLALSVKRGETSRSEVSAEVLKIVDTMSEKKIRDFAKTSHKGLPKKKVQKEEKECGCDDEPKMKERENDTEDMRGVKTKVNLVKNKLRSMGLNMSYEPEGEKIDEVAGLLLKGALAAGGGALAAKGLQHLQKKANQSIDSARQNWKIGGDKRVPQMNSYEPEGEVLGEEESDRANDERLMRGGVGAGRGDSSRPAPAPGTQRKRKRRSSAPSAMNIVRASVEKKYGKGSLM